MNSYAQNKICGHTRATKIISKPFSINYNIRFVCLWLVVWLFLCLLSICLVRSSFLRFQIWTKTRKIEGYLHVVLKTHIYHTKILKSPPQLRFTLNPLKWHFASSKTFYIPRVLNTVLWKTFLLVNVIENEGVERICNRGVYLPVCIEKNRKLVNTHWVH